MAVRCSVVIASRDRRDSVLRTIDRLEALPERPPVLLVDNGSTDGTVRAVRCAHPRTEVVALRRNIGAPARNIGVALARTPYVAFADDDSWWAPGALARAVDRFEADDRLGLLGARILVGPEEREDPTTARIARSPAMLGFLACGAVVRREAYLEVGGFDDLLFFLGEEERVALDLTTRGWRLAYDGDVVAHHHPSPSADRRGRRVRQRRNEVLTAWLRYPRAAAVETTAGVLGEAARGDAAALAAFGEAAVRAPAALRRRAPIPAPLDGVRRALSAS